MKKEMNEIMLLMVVIFSTQSIFAGGAILKSKIESISFQQVGFFMQLSTKSNPNGCTRDSHVVLLKTDSNYDNAYAMLLAAYYSGKEISGYSDGCAGHDAQTFNTIRGFKYLTVR